MRAASVSTSMSSSSPCPPRLHPSLRAGLTGPTDIDGTGAFRPPTNRTRCGSARSKSQHRPHATQPTRRGAKCDSVVRDQARDVPFRPTRMTNKRQCSHRRRGRKSFLWRTSRNDTYFRNRDSYAIVRVAPSGIEELPLVRLRGHRLKQAQDQYPPQSRSVSLYGGSGCKLDITGD